MNERIKLLIEQAYKDVHYDDVPYVVREFDKEKFTELIVKECVEVLLKWKGEPFPLDEDLAASLIKEHFNLK